MDAIKHNIISEIRRVWGTSPVIMRTAEVSHAWYAAHGDRDDIDKPFVPKNHCTVEAIENMLNYMVVKGNLAISPDILEMATQGHARARANVDRTLPNLEEMMRLTNACIEAETAWILELRAALLDAGVDHEDLD